MKKSICNTAFIFLTVLVLSGCMGPKTQGTITPLDGFKSVPVGKDTKAYAKPGYKKLSAYKSYYIAPVKTIHSQNDVKERNKAVVGFLENHLRNAIATELQNKGFKIVNRIDKDTLIMKLFITGLKPQGEMLELKTIQATGTPYDTRLTETIYGFIPDISTVRIESQFINAAKNRIEAVAIVESSGTELGVINDRWTHVSNTFDRWAKGFARTLQTGK